MLARHLTLALAVLLSPLLHAADEHNHLTDQEKKAGWKLLFDGTSTKGWHAIGKDAPTSGWVAKDGELSFVKASAQGPQSDIISTDLYSEFELSWEWKLGEAGNSGVKYNLPDATKPVGIEYQMLDLRHPDAKVEGGKHLAGAFYDVFAPAPEAKIKPAGEWNQSRIVIHGNHVEHFLNGVKTVAFDFGSEALTKGIAASKFKAVKGFGIKTSSPILLQFHGDEVSFRDIKILPAK